MDTGRRPTFHNLYFSVQALQNVLPVAQCTSVCFGQLQVYDPHLIHQNRHK